VIKWRESPKISTTLLFFAITPYDNSISWINFVIVWSLTFLWSLKKLILLTNFLKISSSKVIVLLSALASSSLKFAASVLFIVDIFCETRYRKVLRYKKFHHLDDGKVDANMLDCKSLTLFWWHLKCLSIASDLNDSIQTNLSFLKINFVLGLLHLVWFYSLLLWMCLSTGLSLYK
jgi:hypothetical protein